MKKKWKARISISPAIEADYLSHIVGPKCPTKAQSHLPDP
jgi:hypothetical protein